MGIILGNEVWLAGEGGRARVWKLLLALLFSKIPHFQHRKFNRIIRTWFGSNTSCKWTAVPSRGFQSIV